MRRQRIIGYRKNGAPIWGIMGAAGDDPDEDGQDGGEPQGDPEPSSEPGSEPQEEPLGDSGKKALAEERKARKTAEKQAREAQKRIQEFEDAQKTELERATSAQQDAEKRAGDLLTRAVRAEVRANATDWADPADAPRYLDDLGQYVDDGGEIDSEAISTALTAVLEAKPHLKRDQGPRVPKPDPSQGAKSNGAPTIDDRIADAQANGHWRTVLSLQNQKLADQATNST